MITEFFGFNDNILVLCDEAHLGLLAYLGGRPLAYLIVHLHLSMHVAPLARKLNHCSSGALRVVFLVLLGNILSVKLVVWQCRHVYWNQSDWNFYQVMFI